MNITNVSSSKKNIVVVGGGAGGLELVTRLSRSLKHQVNVILVDRARTHVWKPLLHEVAAGVIDKQSDGVEYAIHASRHGYEFQLGNVSHVDPHAQSLQLDPLLDEDGSEIIPARTLHYDYLVMAVGSVSNDFGTPGVAEHCYMLDSLKQAERFHTSLVNQLLRINHRNDHRQLKIAIIGAGATGTELAAQLHYIGNLARSYGMPEMSSNDLDIRIIEAGPRILPALPEKISYAAKQALQKISVNVMEGTRIASAAKQGLTTAEGELIEADMMVWAAGVKAPEFIQKLDYFDCNRAGQILVNEHLQSTVDEKIFVLGDCAGLELSEGKWVPPRAQSAHQMANTVLTNIQNTLQNKPLKSFNYVDYGSLVHLSKYSTVGSLMGKLSNNNMFIEGRLARVVYKSLYSMHMLAVHGRFKGALTLMSRKVGHLIGPKFKLH